jgi:ACR3 family arsenite efflux pump ArsB
MYVCFVVIFIFNGESIIKNKKFNNKNMNLILLLLYLLLLLLLLFCYEELYLQQTQRQTLVNH